MAAVLAGCSSSPASPNLKADLYAASVLTITQTIINNTQSDLPVGSVSGNVDGTVEPGYPTVIKAGDSGSFTATAPTSRMAFQVSNISVTLNAPNNQSLSLGSGANQAGANQAYAGLSGGNPGAVSAGTLTITGGQTATATFTLDTCPPATTCSQMVMASSVPNVPARS